MFSLWYVVNGVYHAMCVCVCVGVGGCGCVCICICVVCVHVYVCVCVCVCVYLYMYMYVCLYVCYVCLCGGFTNRCSLWIRQLTKGWRLSSTSNCFWIIVFH